MANEKLTQQTEVTEPIATDILYMVDDPGSTPLSRKVQFANLLKAAQNQVFLKAATELTIAADAITVTQTAHKLQPASGTADDLATISGTADGELFLLYVTDEGTDTITLKHGTGNLSCLGGADIELSDGMVVCYSDGTTVYVAGGGGNATTKQFYIQGFKPTLTSGAGYSESIEMGTNKNVYDYLPFDPTSIEYAYANVVMPDDYDGGDITCIFHWLHPATTTNFGVVWGLQGIAITDDGTMDVAQGSMVQTTDTGGTTSDLYQSIASAAFSIDGTPAAGKLVNFRVSRDPTDGSDTMAVDAYLLGVTITYGVV